MIVVMTGATTPLRPPNLAGKRCCGVGTSPGEGGCATSSCVVASSTLQLYSNTITSSAGDTAGGLVFNVTLTYGASICFDNVVLIQQ